MPRRKVTAIKKSKAPDQEFELLLRRAAARLKRAPKLRRKVSAV
jgi:hypothetical protein